MRVLEHRGEKYVVLNHPKQSGNIELTVLCPRCKEGNFVTTKRSLLSDKTEPADKLCSHCRAEVREQVAIALGKEPMKKGTRLGWKKYAKADYDQKLEELRREYGCLE